MRFWMPSRPGHQQRGISEIRVGGGVGEAELDALGLLARAIGMRQEAERLRLE
jgi:hypothetical protein